MGLRVLLFRDGQVMGLGRYRAGIDVAVAVHWRGSWALVRADARAALPSGSRGLQEKKLDMARELETSDIVPVSACRLASLDRAG
jgi:hypothetical protein